MKYQEGESHECPGVSRRKNGVDIEILGRSERSGANISTEISRKKNFIGVLPVCELLP